MSAFARTDRTMLGQWWWTVDRFLLAGIGLLVLIGAIMVLASSPPIARNLDLDGMHFVIRHFVVLVPAAVCLFVVSLLAPRGVLRLATFVFVVFWLLTLATLQWAPEIKGATRWLFIGGQQLQPSEFLKPGLAVVCAWLIASRPGLAGLPFALALVAATVGLLLLQPDLGMAVVIGAFFSAQLFVAGLGWLPIILLASAGAGALWSAYQLLPHVRERIDGFLDPTAEIYQVERALSAVQSGGIFGRGPGEGVVKFRLPEAHSDFVFATVAEEFGIIACLIVVMLFAGLVLRTLWRLQLNPNRFVQLAATGLIAQFGLQALVNMAVNVNLVPTKGMTLPFISYGGSSLVAMALTMGMLLALTRRGARLEPLP
jgi:cell division protein FtsW